MQCLDIAKEDETKKDAMLDKFNQFQLNADMYYIYHHIHRFVPTPFIKGITYCQYWRKVFKPESS